MCNQLWFPRMPHEVGELKGHVDADLAGGAGAAFNAVVASLALAMCFQEGANCREGIAAAGPAKVDTFWAIGSARADVALFTHLEIGAKMSCWRGKGTTSSESSRHHLYM